MNEAVANAIYDVLVKTAGAPERDRPTFVYHQTNERIVEWRFSGKLGFGGKFWRNGERWYINCYREDSTPETEAVIQEANEQLAALCDKFGFD